LGLKGDDHLIASGGADTLDGGTGADTMEGGLGDDTYFVDDHNDVIIEGIGAGTDTLTTATSYVLSSTAEIETITLGGKSGIDLTASDTDNNITGNAGGNHIFGMGGNDTLTGGDGDDVLNGGDGDDVIFGQGGSDTMTGGIGADTFVFEAATALTHADHITDFNVGQNDVLDISDLLSAYDSATDLLTDFVRITDSGHDTKVEVDIDGSGTAAHFVTIATLDNVTGLTGEAALVAAGHLIV